MVKIGKRGKEKSEKCGGIFRKMGRKRSTARVYEYMIENIRKRLKTV